MAADRGKRLLQIETAFLCKLQSNERNERFGQRSGFENGLCIHRCAVMRTAGAFRMRGCTPTGLRFAASSYDNVSMKYSPLRNDDGSPNVPPAIAAYGCLGFGVCAALFGWSLWQEPPVPPFHGGVAWLYSLGVTLFGPQGPAIATWLLATLFLGLGAAIWARVRG
jgi:hypothetical protein